MTPEEEANKCDQCGGDKRIRNPTGKCDHLYGETEEPKTEPDYIVAAREAGKKAKEKYDMSDLMLQFKNAAMIMNGQMPYLQAILSEGRALKESVTEGRDETAELKRLLEEQGQQLASIKEELESAKLR